jgi:hypothetical protein
MAQRKGFVMFIRVGKDINFRLLGRKVTHFSADKQAKRSVLWDILSQKEHF